MLMIVSPLPPCVQRLCIYWCSLTAISDGIPLLLLHLLAHTQTLESQDQIQTPRAEGVSRCTRTIYFLALPFYPQGRK